MSSTRFRRIKRLGAALTAGALGVGFLPIAALTGTASAAAPTPTAVDTSAFCANVPPDNPFTDLPSTDVHFDNVLCMAFAGITKGKTATTYDPSTPVRRDQMASFIARSIDKANALETPGGPDAPLTDLPAAGTAPDAFGDDTGDVHEDNINRLADAGIVQGLSDPQCVALGATPPCYGPAEPVTRAQMASFINRAIGFLTGTPLASDANGQATDFFDDDNGNVHEANINGLASVGIVQGTGGGMYTPLANVPRDQMGSFIIRYLAYLNGLGDIDILPPATTTNQTLDVQPQDAATNPLGTARTYTVTGLGAGNVNIRLFNCDYVSFDANGVASFPQGTNPGTNTNNNAQPGPTGSAFISSINGTPNTGPVNQFQVSPQNGSVTFTVNTPAAPTNGPGACVRPVVFDGSNGNLELGTDNTPSTDHFGVGGSTFFVPTAASSSGSIDVTVQAVDRTSHSFIGCTGYTADPIGPTAGPGTFSGCTTFTYKMGDTLKVTDPYFAQFSVPSDFTKFETDISPYDEVTGSYGDPANSNLELTDTSPAPPPLFGPQSVQVVPNAAGSPANNVTLQFGDSETPSASTYIVFRAPATDNGNAANPRFTCPARNIKNFPATNAPATTNPTQPAEADYTLLGVVPDTDPSGATNRVYTFVDTTATAGSAVCYAVVVLDGPSAHVAFLNAFHSGFTPFGEPTGVGASIPGAVAGAPKIQDARAQDTAGSTIGILDTNDVIQLVFNEPMDPDSLFFNGFDFTVQDGDVSPTIAQVSCGGNADCFLEPAGTYNGITAVKNQVLRVVLFADPVPTQAGTVPFLQYPLTITALTNGFTDADEGLPIDLAGSPDKTIETGTLTPTPGSEPIDMVVGSANATQQTATIFYNDDIQCTGAVPGQFVANVGVPGGGQSATSLVCDNGFNELTVTFPANTITDGVPLTITYNQAANQVDRIHRAGQPAVDAVSPDSVTINNPTSDVATPTSVTPDHGDVAGGYAATVNGFNFTCSGTTVTFGGTNAGVTNCTPGAIGVTVPAHSAGLVDVVVTDSSGNNTCVNCFNYQVPAPPGTPSITDSQIINAGPTGGGSILVTYNMNVTCRGAGQFVFTDNETAHENPNVVNTGPATTISQTSPNQCTLSGFPNTGPSNNEDAGSFLTYTQSAVVGDRITDSSNVTAAQSPQSSNGVDDNIPPMFAAGSTAASGTGVVTVKYDTEVIDCSSVDAGDYNVSVNGSPNAPVASVSCAMGAGTGATVAITMSGGAAAFGPGSSITVTARNGNDGNTVDDNHGNRQPVGDATGTITAT